MFERNFEETWWKIESHGENFDRFGGNFKGVPDQCWKNLSNGIRDNFRILFKENFTQNFRE